MWTSIAAACEQLSDDSGTLPTDCPGWTVKDHLSHLIGIERMLLGDPSPPSLTEVPAHVRNPFGEINEAWVEARRPVPGSEVLAEFVADRPTGGSMAPVHAGRAVRRRVGGARSVTCPIASSWPPGSSTPGPTSRTSAGPWAGPAAATGSASGRPRPAARNMALRGGEEGGAARRVRRALLGRRGRWAGSFAVTVRPWAGRAR